MNHLQDFLILFDRPRASLRHRNNNIARQMSPADVTAFQSRLVRHLVAYGLICVRQLAGVQGSWVRCGRGSGLNLWVRKILVTAAAPLHLLIAYINSQGSRLWCLPLATLSSSLCNFQGRSTKFFYLLHVCFSRNGFVLC